MINQFSPPPALGVAPGEVDSPLAAFKYGAMLGQVTASRLSSQQAGAI